VKLVAASFVQLVEFVADSLMPPEQQSFVASHRQRRWFTLMESTMARRGPEKGSDHLPDVTSKNDVQAVSRF